MYYKKLGACAQVKEFLQILFVHNLVKELLAMDLYKMTQQEPRHSNVVTTTTTSTQRGHQRADKRPGHFGSPKESFEG